MVLEKKVVIPGERIDWKRYTYDAWNRLGLSDAAGVTNSDSSTERNIRSQGGRGWYTSGRYRELLETHEIEPSMSRTGNCYDNAMAESFWGKLKTEMVYHRRFKTKAEARVAVFDYIEVFYSPTRLHAALGYLSPEQFEARRYG